MLCRKRVVNTSTQTEARAINIDQSLAKNLPANDVCCGERCLVASWHIDSGPLVVCTRTVGDRSPKTDGPWPHCSSRSGTEDLQREEERNKR